MCGIVGAVAKRSVAHILLDGLKRLEYRGYDSAGMAVIESNADILRLRTMGKVCELEQALSGVISAGFIGIAHTRWATHGEPAERNAHPHMSGEDVAIVHNGIIENHESIRHTLKQKGYELTSDTDSELIAHLIQLHRQTQSNLHDAVRAAASELQGAFALGVIDRREPDRIIAVRKGSPLVIGIGGDEHFIASDHLALVEVAEEFIYLQEGDSAEIRQNEITIWNAQHKKVKRAAHKPELHHYQADKGEFRHFMLKEIYDQPEAVAETLASRLGDTRVLEQAFGRQAVDIFAKTKCLQIVACGTSHHAALIAKYWFEEHAKVLCRVEIASEFRYRKTVVQPGTLFVTISQSGETADTIAALRMAKEQGYVASLAICNVPESTLVRESDLTLMTRAGVEIGVASTKAFTTQLTALLMLMVNIGRYHGLSEEQEAEVVKALHKLPEYISETLALNDHIAELAQAFADKQHALFLGRGVQYPVAREGALKLKEISYIHAEAYPAGELKHGPLALVDKNMPVITVAPNDELLEKLMSNIHEVRARGGQLYVFADESTNFADEKGVTILRVPAYEKILAPIIYAIPLQFLAYHVAVLKGTDVDQPRNLAKSVTVE